MNAPRLHDHVAATIDDVQAMVGPFGLEVISIHPMRSGLINTNIRVDTSAQSHLLRIYNTERTREQVEFELSTLQRLVAAGFPTQAPLESGNGRVGTWDGRLYAVLTFLPGEELAEDALSSTVSRVMGETVGLMQSVLDGFVPDGTKPPADVDFIDDLVNEACSEIVSFAGSGPLIEEIRSSWLEARSTREGRNDSMGVVHADIYPGNVIYRDGVLTGLIDFDDAYFGTMLFDVAIAAMEFGFVGDVDLDSGLVREFIEGYTTYRPGIEVAAVVDAMWVNCYRFFAYTLPITLADGDAPTENVYLKRIRFFSEPQNRSSLVRALQ